MQRIPEPEVMNDADEVEAYRQADFRDVNRRCARRAWRACSKQRGHALDLGCGPAEIPIFFCQLAPRWRVTAVDASRAMLAEARHNIDAHGLGQRIKLVRGNARSLGKLQDRFDLIFSNSLLHHLGDPVPFWREVKRLLKPDGRVMVQDLFRPTSAAQARRLVAKHAAGATPLLRRLFQQSLLAAFTPAEVRQQLCRAGLEALGVRKVSDRHLVVRGQP